MLIYLTVQMLVYRYRYQHIKDVCTCISYCITESKTYIKVSYFGYSRVYTANSANIQLCNCTTVYRVSKMIGLEIKFDDRTVM